LKLALLDYLRNHGNDAEKIQMVALKYGMFRELAKTRESQATNEVKSLRQKQLSELLCVCMVCLAHKKSLISFV